MTYTCAVMKVSSETFQEIKTNLLNAGYHHAIHDDGGLDMTHIILKEDASIFETAKIARSL
jgi:hypothetical protein